MQRGIVRRHDDIGEEGLHMGWFSDAFEIGAGATLGSLATVGAVHVGASVLSGIDAKKFAEYRAEHFDPVVFDDLDNLLVHKSLPEIPYPFPDAASAAAEAAGSSWQRKVIVAGLAGSLVLAFIGLGISTEASLNSLFQWGIGLFWVFAFWGIGSLIVKGLKKGKQAIGDKTYREKLDAAGSRYWYIREHVRQGVASGQMGFKDAIRKLAATDLVQQFPYTFDEIEAHAFYFQQNEQK